MFPRLATAALLLALAACSDPPKPADHWTSPNTANTDPPATASWPPFVDPQPSATSNADEAAVTACLAVRPLWGTTGPLDAAALEKVGKAGSVALDGPVKVQSEDLAVDARLAKEDPSDYNRAHLRKAVDDLAADCQREGFYG